MKLSDTQRTILTEASGHEWRLAPLPKLPKAAATAVLKSLLSSGLLAECTAPHEHADRGWRQDADDARIALRITDAGLQAIGIDPALAPVAAEAMPGAEAAPTGAPEAPPQDNSADATEAAQGAPGAPDGASLAEDLVLLDQALAERRAPARASLRDAAAAVLAAWDDEANREADIVGALEGPMERLRASLAGKPARGPRVPGAPRKPREGTKQEQVLALLRRPEGATVAQITEATGWAPHTVRGFFAGLKKRQGIAVEVLERVRQVGPNKEGARGSYTIYKVAG